MLIVRKLKEAVSTTSLGHFPSGPKWEFDATVTRVFGDMLRRSIPDYEVMRQVTTQVARAYMRPGTDVVDLGASRGDGIESLLTKAPADLRMILCDVSEPMVETAKVRFKQEIEQGKVQVQRIDLRTQFPITRPASVTLAVLTLQFIPIEHRQQVLVKAYENTAPGGVLLVVEKLLGETPDLHHALTEMYRQRKREAGYTLDEIEKKAQSLEGVLVPLTASWNEQMMERAGWKRPECIWRSLNFGAWMAVK